ncbi:MAG: hypothetical protein QXN16_04355 [Candidatus Micrarchaeaceae archaeon]
MENSKYSILKQNPVNIVNQIMATDPKNARTYVLTFNVQTNINLYDMLKTAPTDSLYQILDLITKILGERSDSKR